MENRKIVSSEVMDTNGNGYSALAGVLSALHVDALICGGIGGGAQAAEALAAGNLTFDSGVRRNHHDHHGEGHTCVDYSYGSIFAAK